MNQEVQNTSSFASTPKDGRWYTISPDIYIKWNDKNNTWCRMMIKPGDTTPRFADVLSDGTELSGVDK